MSQEEYERAALKLLGLLIQVTGWTRRRLDARLGFAQGYLSRLLTGNTKLLYTHILAILAEVEIEPAQFFAVLHPEAERRTVIELVERARRIAAGEEPVPESLDERMQRFVDRVKVECGGRTRRKPRRPRTGAQLSGSAVSETTRRASAKIRPS
jgi:transcriptional regulator with XRE-family HTH domain